MDNLFNTLRDLWPIAWPYITTAVTVASALETLPQPQPGSHWIPVRKVISVFALAIGGASSGKQPALGTWLLRIVQPYLRDQGLKLVAAEAADEINKETSHA